MNVAAGEEPPSPARKRTTPLPVEEDYVVHNVVPLAPEPAVTDHGAHDVVLDDVALARLRNAFNALDGDDALEAIVEHPRYRPLDVLGEGGMGTVHRCRDELLGREVAMKVVRATTSARQAMFAARLQAESRILARLEHAGIVPIHDVGQLADGRVFYVMQRLRGRTLRVVLADHASGRASVSLARRLDLMERIAEAVAYAHGQGIVHRDLKPDNVMVGDFGEVHVTDWGVARALLDKGADAVCDAADCNAAAREDAIHTGQAQHESRERLTADGTVIGTPGYMAPEQAAGLARTVGPAADVYALGGLLVSLLTGRELDTSAVPAAQLGGVKSNVPPAVRSIVHRCLAYDAAQRYPHAGALLDELRRYRSGDPVLAHREGAIEQVVRRLRPWRTAVLLIVAYLVMRLLVAWLGSGRNTAAGAP